MITKLIIIANRLSYFITDFKYYLLFFVGAFSLGIIILVIKRSRLTLVFTSLFLSLLTCFLLLEFYYRYVFDATDNVYHIKTTRRWITRHVQWNGNGYRDNHFWREKDPRETRILFLGDSYTFGYGINNVNQRYTELLGAKLRADCPPGKTLKTYNLGLPGNQSLTYLKLLSTEVFRFQPDALVMQYYLDDIAADQPASSSSNLAKGIYAYQNKPIIGFILRHSYALEYLYIRLAARLLPQHDWAATLDFNQNLYADDAIWQRHLSTLQKIIAATRGAAKLPLVVFIIPLSHRLGPDYPLTQVHQKLINFFTSQKIPVLDMLPVLSQYPPEQIMVSRHDFHLNEFGHQLIADNLYQLIKDNPAFQCR